MTALGLRRSPSSIIASSLPTFVVATACASIGPRHSQLLYSVLHMARGSGGPGTWVTRTYTATRGGGAFLNGQRISVSKTEQLQRSLLVRLSATHRDCSPNFIISLTDASHLQYLHRRSFGLVWCVRTRKARVFDAGLKIDIRSVSSTQSGSCQCWSMP